MISDAEVAVAAALAGAEVVRAGFGAALARFDKGQGDFATAADLDAERAILGVLGQWRPGDAVIGEETGRTGAAGAGRRWLVDPLCGTLNYAVGVTTRRRARPRDHDQRGVRRRGGRRSGVPGCAPPPA